MLKSQFIAVAVLFFSFSSNANAQNETIICESKSGSIRSLTAVRHHYGYEPQWFDAEVKTGIFRKKQRASLTPLYMNGRYVLKDTWGSLIKTDLIVDLGQFKGEGAYRANVIRFKGDTENEDPFQMDCVVKGKTPFVNYCESSKYGSPTETLFYAAENRSPDLLDMVLACDVDVNQKNGNGCTPFMVAVDRECGTGKYDIFNHFAPLDRVVESLAEVTPNVDQPDPVTGETGLGKVVKYQDDPLAKLLLERGANVDAADKDGFTPLMRAVETRYMRMVRLLLQHLPNKELKNKNGQTAYDIAKAIGATEIMELLSSTAQEVVIEGKADGTCSPSMIHLNQGTTAKLVLKASGKMILFEAPDLNIELMAMPNGTDEENYTFDVKGTFPFKCGEHGGSNSTEGSIMVM